ncbi:5185_t:CDS:1, partial [Funneliformis mosseae]
MYPYNCYNGQILSNGKVTQAILDLRGKLCFVVVRLENGVQIDLPVPTIQEISERFFYRKAKTQPDKPARPPNKFFIFRTMFQVAIDNFKLQVPIVSSLASEVWRKCTPEVIEIFTKLSNIAKMEHGKLNPGY